MTLFNRPHFTEYVMARMVTIAVVLFTLFTLAAVLLGKDTQLTILAIVSVGITFILFLFAIYRGASRMQKELKRIDTYLSDLEEEERQGGYQAHFFTREFNDINKHLLKVLKKAKKREEVKRRYTAKLKLHNRQRADMISAIAHEFRNPIASIMGYSQTLREDPDIPLPLQQKFLEKIYHNGDKIEALLGRLILWNKFESGDATLHKSYFDLYTATEEVKQILKEKYKNREIHLFGSSCMVEADRTLIDVVLKNLIENALKYSKEDVEVSVGSDGTVSVKDYGVGISEKDQGKVTRKFYRSGTHSWNNSMGLGLSIVKTILRMHNSDLKIESQVHEGSTFSFTLPIADKPQSTKSQ